jgi:AbrB family looped-hinge helix DNA binding protein
LTALVPYDKVRNIDDRKECAVASATLTSKGQITIPASVRAELGLEEGTRVEFVKIAEGKYAIMPATISAMSLKGRFRGRGAPLTIEEMNRIIAERGASAR